MGNSRKSDKPSIWKRLHWGQLIAVIIPSAVVALFLMYYFTTSHELRPGFEHFTTVYRDWKPSQSFPLPGKIYYRSSDSSVVMAHDLWSNDDYKAVKAPGKVLGYSPYIRSILYSDSTTTYIKDIEDITARSDISFVGRKAIYAYPIGNSGFALDARWDMNTNLFIDREGNLDTLGRCWISSGNSDGVVVMRVPDYGLAVVSGDDTLFSVRENEEFYNLQMVFYGDDKVLVYRGYMSSLKKRMDVFTLHGELLDSLIINSSSKIKILDWTQNSGYVMVVEEDERRCPFRNRIFYHRTLYRGTEKLIDYPLTQMNISPMKIFQDESGDYILYSDKENEEYYVSRDDAFSLPFTIDEMYRFYGWAN